MLPLHDTGQKIFFYAVDHIAPVNSGTYMQFNGEALPQKVRNFCWTQSVPPAVAGGYVVDELDLLMFRKPDPLPTGYRRWY